MGYLATADSDALNIETTTAEETYHPVKHPRLILYQGN
jgi:hypothetical protein